MSNFYEIEEDSILLLNSIVKFKNFEKYNKIFEVGVGSGYVISEIAKLKLGEEYFGSDINPFAILNTKKKFNDLNVKIELKNTSFFKGFEEEKFEMILFNTPYLPLEDGETLEDLDIKDRAIYGGKLGYETIVDFILQINDNLESEGEVFMVFSSLSNLDYIRNFLLENCFEFKILKTKKTFFEEMYCIKIVKSSLLKSLSSRNVTSIRSFSQGKHSKVLEGKYNGENCIIKYGKFQHLQKEQMFMEKLKGEFFVPTLYFYDENYIVREKINGTLILDFFENCSKSDLILVLERLIQICQRLDDLKINKFELVNPYKHIFIQDNLEIYFIDFERCIYTDKPKNITQILECFRRNLKNFLRVGLNISEEKIFDIGKKHRKDKIRFKLKDLISS